MLRKTLLAVLVLASVVCSFAFTCEDGPSSSATAGTYILTEPSTIVGGTFKKSDVGEMSIELKKDGSFYLRMPGASYVGSWRLSGDTIELQHNIWGSTMVWTGTVSRDTISLDDGSVWKMR